MADVKEPAMLSESRQHVVEVPTSLERAADVRAQQVRAVGTAFLRARPLIVAPVALTNSLALVASGAPVTQRVSMVLAIGSALLLFIFERIRLRHVLVSERWLGWSLFLTLIGLGLGVVLSGGVMSPLSPLLLAPMAVTFAAFGFRAPTRWIVCASVSFAALLTLLPVGVPFPLVPDNALRVMWLASFVGLVALVGSGVAGLVEAYARASARMERLRISAMEESAVRTRSLEQVGAKVAHELKNPLSAIKALLQLLQQGASDERTNKRLSVALSEVERMHQTIQDYLTFARPMSELVRQEVDIQSLCEDVIFLFEPRARAQGVTLVSEGESLRVWVDPRRLREALVNLLDNAIVATPRAGTVKLVWSGKSGTLLMDVIDSGIGLSPELRDRIGQPFVSGREGGTGLGLVIARAAVEQHGGSLTLASRAEGGTRATLDLPIARPGNGGNP